MIAACLAMTTASTLADESEIHVGRSAAGQIKVEIHFDPPLELEPSVFPGISGYATGLLGMHSADADDPTNDFFEVSTAADFRLILLAKDPGMEIWKFPASFVSVGETIFIGQAPFDNHQIWNLVTNTPGVAYSLTLKMHDVNGIYTDSDPFGLRFTAQIIRHQINLAQTDALHATLSWTANSAGWALESATSVTAVNWDIITNVPGITGTNFSLSISTSGSQKFFRLRQP